MPKANTVPSSGKLLRSLKALNFAVKHPLQTFKQTKSAIKNIYSHGIMQSSRLPGKDIFELIDNKTEAVLSNFQIQNGNVSYHELLIISSLIAFYRPKNLLEIGTFNGNTTLQMALNAPEDAIIHTLDLPPLEVATKEPVLTSDLPFILEKDKRQRKYLNSRASFKIRQYLGDSTSYDFKLFAQNRLLDFVFIDGGHSYECVKSDTQKTLQLLAPGGIILWHDFIPHYSGIYRYLHELRQKLNVVHIKDTTLAFYQKD